MSIDYQMTSQMIEQGRLLGYETGRLPLLLLAPLVQVAWVDGSLQPAEKRAILNLSERLKLLNTSAREELMSWLHDRPAVEILDRSLQDLRTFFERVSGEEAERLRSFLRFGMVEVARASGGPGFVPERSKIEKQERDAMLELAEQLGLEEPELPR